MAACERGNASEPNAREGRFGLPARALRRSAGRAGPGLQAARCERHAGPPDRGCGNAPSHAQRTRALGSAHRGRSRRPQRARGGALGRSRIGRRPTGARHPRLPPRRTRHTARSFAGRRCLASAVARRLAASARSLAEERERARRLPGCDRRPARLVRGERAEPPRGGDDRRLPDGVPRARAAGAGHLLPPLPAPAPVPPLGQPTPRCPRPIR